MLQAVRVLTKHNKPFTDAKVFTECMVTVLEETTTDKSMDRIIASVKQVPLSAKIAQTTNCCVHILANGRQATCI